MIDPADCNLHEFEDETAEVQACLHCGAKFAKIERKPGYDERADAQVAAWVKGESNHNEVDGECCPDFSCCSDQRTPKEDRERFATLVGRAREEMLMSFLGRMVEREGAGGKVHIAGREE